MGRGGLEIKMSVILNIIYCFNAIPNRISTSCCLYTDELILRFILKGRRQRIAHTVLMEKDQVGGWAPPNSALRVAESMQAVFFIF